MKNINKMLLIGLAVLVFSMTGCVKKEEYNKTTDETKEITVADSQTVTESESETEAEIIIVNENHDHFGYGRTDDVLKPGEVRLSDRVRSDFENASDEDMFSIHVTFERLSRPDVPEDKIVQGKTIAEWSTTRDKLNKELDKMFNDLKEDGYDYYGGDHMFHKDDNPKVYYDLPDNLKDVRAELSRVEDIITKEKRIVYYETVKAFAEQLEKQSYKIDYDNKHNILSYSPEEYQSEGRPSGLIIIGTRNQIQELKTSTEEDGYYLSCIGELKNYKY